MATLVSPLQPSTAAPPTFFMTDFKPFWTVNGQRYDDFGEVERLVLAGAVAIETSAERQRERYERQQLLNKWVAKRRELAERFTAEQQHRQSPEGRRELAVRNAQQHPGGIVSGAGNPVFDELDQYGPDASNVFK